MKIPASLTKKQLLAAFRLMATSRRLDEKMLIMLKGGKSFFHIGCMGHEAIQVAGGINLIPKHDWLFPYYRDLAFCMSLGFTAKDALLGFLGKADDPSSGGRQMPQHYGHADYNIPTSSSSTGTQYLQAVGNAFASMRLQKVSLSPRGRGDKLEVTVVCSGEGTTSQGDFHEALSWASREKAPVIFLVEDNGYAISVPVKDQRPGGDAGKIAEGYHDLKQIKVDGCDFLASYIAFKKAVAHARAGKGPVLIHADVVRLLPHSSSDDQRKYRPKDELDVDLKNDPIVRMKEILLQTGSATLEDIQQIEKDVKEEVNRLADEAEKAPFPDPATVAENLYSKSPLSLPDDQQGMDFHLCEDDSGGARDNSGTELVMVDAINRALDEGLRDNPNMLIYGQDVAGGKGGVFTATRNLTEKHGEGRCFNGPLAESSIVGVGIGLAMRGFKPVVEIQFADYIWTAMMQIRNELATVRYRSNGMFSCPMVIRVPIGGYIHGGLCHSQNIESYFAHIPGLRVVMPSTALDAYGLLKEAIASDDPVLFLEHKSLYRQSFAKSVIANSGNGRISFGSAAVRRKGTDVTVITYGALVQKALDASRELEKDEISTEVVDLRSIAPIDWETIQASVSKTNRCLVLYEDNRFMGFGAEIAAEISERYFQELDAPVQRLAGKNIHIPYAPALEESALVQVGDINMALKKMVTF